MPLIPATLFGNNLTNLVRQPESGEYNLTAEGVLTITRVWEADYIAACAFAPVVRSPDPEGTNALCVSVSITRREPGIGRVTAVYQGFLYLPFTIYEFANSRMDRPINMHPRFRDEAYFPGDPVTGVKVYSKVTDPTTGAVIAYGAFEKFKDAPNGDPLTKFAGIESFVVGNAQWRKTSYSMTPDFDQTDVGKLNAPEAASYVLPDGSNSAKKWLKIEKTCRNLLKGASLIWEITEVWQYNDLAWTDEIYSP